MTRKFLEDKGLSKELIDEILDENSKDIGKAKGELETVKSQLETAQNTDYLDQEFIDDVTDYVDNTDLSVYDKETANADMWDKHNIDIYDWLDRLQDDLDNGTTHAWTSIPDVVTDFLKDYGGYDGVIDKGGKGGGVGHTVAIPFYSNQIKSTDNLNPTENEDIRYSKRESTKKYTNKEFRGAFDKKEWYDYKEAKRKLELYNEYDYGDRAFTRIATDSGEKIVCFEAFGVDGKIEPYRVYEVGVDYNIHDDDTFNREVIEAIINLERDGRNERIITERLGTYQFYVENTLFRRYDAQSVGFRTLRNGAWRKLKSNVGADTKSENDGAGFDEFGNQTRKSLKEQPRDYSSLLSENEELVEINESLKQMIKLVATENDELREEFGIKTVRSSKESSVQTEQTDNSSSLNYYPFVIYKLLIN